MRYNVLYRGPLSSCNYACAYCPFAKRAETHAELEGDRQALDRFLRWLEVQKDAQFGVLFTPWGEALIHRSYQNALCGLSRLQNVRRVAIQTNLSGTLDWVSGANPKSLALWCTVPDQPPAGFLNTYTAPSLDLAPI